VSLTDRPFEARQHSLLAGLFEAGCRTVSGSLSDEVLFNTTRLHRLHPKVDVQADFPRSRECGVIFDGVAITRIAFGG
jgi:hypothetical protein